MLSGGEGIQKFAVADSEFLSILTVTDEGGATFGTVYDDADARFIAAANPATVIELINRLEAAESDALEQARLNGMGASREATLMAKLEAAENERAIDEQRIADLMAELNRVGQENEELRAKIEIMEQQAPVASVWRCDNGHIHGSCERTLPMGTKLYALPGAKGESE